MPEYSENSKVSSSGRAEFLSRIKNKTDSNVGTKTDQLSDNPTSTTNSSEFEERQDPEDDCNLDDFNPCWTQVTKLKIKTNGLKLYGNFNAPIWHPTEMTSNADLLIKIMKDSKLEGVIPCHKKFICDNVPYPQ